MFTMHQLHGKIPTTKTYQITLENSPKNVSYTESDILHVQSQERQVQGLTKTKKDHKQGHRLIVLGLNTPVCVNKTDKQTTMLVK